MIKMMMRIIIVALFAMFVGACSSPKDANEKNFSKAVQDYLTFRSGKFCKGEYWYPHTALVYPAPPKYEKLGLIKKVGRLYDLTDKGRKFYKEGKGLCFGVPVLVRIENFSVPQVANGQTISNVNYEYTLSDNPEWDFELSKLEKPMQEYVSSFRGFGIFGKSTLILTNNGWIHEDLFRQ